MHHVKHYLNPFIPAILLVIMVFVMATPVFAVADPDTLEINGVYVYRNCLEENDQLYLVDYTVNYSSNPTSNASDVIYCRLMNGSTELALGVPYDYFDDGYSRGVIAFYFNPDDAPTWEGSYTVEVAGNPSLTWDDGTPPYVSIGTFDLWQDNEQDITQQILSGRITWLAQRLDENWSTSFSLINTTTVGIFLSAYGIEYFFQVIGQDLNEITPYALADRTVMPEYDNRDYQQDYSNDLETDILNTKLDLTDTGDIFGMSRGAITAILYYGVVLWFGVWLSKQLQTHKPVMLLMVPLVILGAFIGVPLVITILVAFVALIMIGFTLFYNPSSA